MIALKLLLPELYVGGVEIVYEGSITPDTSDTIRRHLRL